MNLDDLPDLSQDPTAWFDQFPAAPDWDHPQWCPRHWAPAPLLGGNGLGASIEMLQIFLDELATASTADGLNSEMANMGRICCTLGDERMYEIWGHWPPTSESVTAEWVTP